MSCEGLALVVLAAICFCWLEPVLCIGKSRKELKRIERLLKVLVRLTLLYVLLT